MNAVHEAGLKWYLKSSTTGTTPQTFSDENVGIPWYSPESLGEQSTHLGEPKKRVPREGLGVRIFPANSVLIVGIGTLGKLAVSTEDCSGNQQINCLTPLDSLNARYLAYALTTKTAEMYSLAGSSTLHILNQERMRSLRIPVISTAAQERIANFLDDKTARIDALIAEKERLAESLKDIEEVTAFDMVTRGLDSSIPRTSFVEPWLAEVPRHWSLAKIRNLATVGNGSTPKRDNEDYWTDGTLPWLNSGSVNSSRIVDASDYVTPVAVKECHLPTVRAGSTVVALTGQGKTRGRAAFTEFDTTINQHLAYISLYDQTMSDEYLWVALTGFYSVFRYISDGEGDTKGALTCEELNKFRLPIPPPDEQAAIVKAYLARIQSIDTLKAHTEAHIVRLREYRSSLISAAVTGQLDTSTFQELA